MMKNFTFQQSAERSYGAWAAAYFAKSSVRLVATTRRSLPLRRDVLRLSSEAGFASSSANLAGAASRKNFKLDFGMPFVRHCVTAEGEMSHMAATTVGPPSASMISDGVGFRFAIPHFRTLKWICQAL